MSDRIKVWKVGGGFFGRTTKKERNLRQLGLGIAVMSIVLTAVASDYVAAPMDTNSSDAYWRSSNFKNFQNLIVNETDSNYIPGATCDNRKYLATASRSGTGSWAASALDCLEIAHNKGVSPSSHGELCYYNKYLDARSKPVKLTCNNMGCMDYYPMADNGNLWRAAAFLVSWRADLTDPTGTRYHVLDYRVIPPRASVNDNARLKRAIMRYGAVSVPYHYPLADADTTPNTVGTACGWTTTGYIVLSYNIGGLTLLTIPYSNASFGTSTQLIAYPAPAAEKETDVIQQYDYSGPMTCVGSAASSVWNYGPVMANVFTAPKNGTLDGFSFYTGDVGVQIDYKIYLNPTVKNGQVTGTAVASSTSTIEINNVGYELESYGWYYYKLPKSIALKKGDTYAIAVGVRYYSNAKAIAIEYQVDGYAPAAGANGQSFLGYNYNAMYDTYPAAMYGSTLPYSNAHVCLKAYLTSIPTVEPTPITAATCTTWDAYTNAIIRNAAIAATNGAPAISFATCSPTTPSPGSSGAGKTHPTGEPITIYDEFIMGTDPTDDASKFTASIAISNGIPVVTWSPALNGPAVPTGIRTYTTFGSTNLTDWTALDAIHPDSAYKFFKVTVSLP